jgi:pSer/pThr/pTyr-binding forkhead associated (FHA) protein
MVENLLVTVLLKDQVLQQHSFEAVKVQIGRHRACDVVLDNPAVSRVHARITCENDAIYLEDPGSANGLLLNGRPVKREALKDGDIVGIGKFSLHIALPTRDADTSQSVTLSSRDLTFRVDGPDAKR